jgi:hypothetical protein
MFELEVLRRPVEIEAASGPSFFQININLNGRY